MPFKLAFGTQVNVAHQASTRLSAIVPHVVIHRPLFCIHRIIEFVSAILARLVTLRWYSHQVVTQTIETTHEVAGVYSLRSNRTCLNLRAIFVDTPLGREVPLLLFESVCSRERRQVTGRADFVVESLLRNHLLESLNMRTCFLGV